MSTISERDVKESFGLRDWRHLTKDHFLQLFSSIPDMDKDLAIKILDQIPELKSLSLAALDDMAKTFDSTMSANTASVTMVHAIATERMALLRRELERDDLDPAARLRVLDEARDVHRAMDLKDTENKRFLSEEHEKQRWFALACMTTVAAILVGAAAKGGAGRSILGRVA